MTGAARLPLLAITMLGASLVGDPVFDTTTTTRASLPGPYAGRFAALAAFLRGLDEDYE